MSSLQLFATVSLWRVQVKATGCVRLCTRELANVYTLLAIGMSFYPCPSSRGLSNDLV